MAVRSPASTGPDQHIVDLASAMLARISELADQLAERICAEIPFYANSDLVSRDELVTSCAANMRFVFRSIRGEPGADVSAARETGTARAAAGAPLASVMAAYRVGFRFMWEETLAQARRNPDLTPDAILDATTHIMITQDEFTQAMTDAYRDQLTIQILGDEAERAALVEALLYGQITDTRSLWEVADALRMPTRGPYVVVAARLAAIGKTALPQIAAKLDARDVRSAWRLDPDLQIGLVALPRAGSERALIEVLSATAGERVGVSPKFDELSGTGEALLLARAAAAERSPDGSLITVFDDSPLALAALSAPEAMTRIGRRLLAGLDDLPAEERAILVTTFEAWVDAGGSANETAAKIFCHPNTVRHRLRRIEERTGKSLSRPRDVAELCLAVEVERRLPEGG
ncbi:helix-turn-helix domain-containing protein [Aldersonia sp. NBC_00410]|uniref:PucR family transcriptional regulator n=1 Tax=Aldersonia sp. NBC_00410 TaxID=2975954 RepID=UPI00225676C0|nr:helix-turn-helix domain-containing protein [Aldersonia sp. NBC_00410]MCX5045247.1 helix-turn-helix domain-containing protein [Aldersonia sp. NBC_00410]